LLVLVAPWPAALVLMSRVVYYPPDLRLTLWSGFSREE
jgi:hypothetical protein